MILPRLLGESFHEIDTRPPRKNADIDLLPLSVADGNRETIALLIEANGTIYDDSHWWRWITRMVVQLGVPVHFSEFYGHWEQHYLPKACREGCGFWQVLEQQLKDFGMSAGTCAELLAAARSRRSCLDRGIRLFPGVARTLAHLRGNNVTLIALANSPCTGDEFRECLQRTGVFRYFDALYTAQELGQRISDAESLCEILRQLDVQPSEAAFASNCVMHRQAAAEVGLLTIGFDGPPICATDLCLDRFSDLLDHLSFRRLHRQAG